MHELGINGECMGWWRLGLERMSGARRDVCSGCGRWGEGLLEGQGLRGQVGVGTFVCQPAISRQAVLSNGLGWELPAGSLLVMWQMGCGRPGLERKSGVRHLPPMPLAG